MSLKSRVKKLAAKLGEPVGERCPTCRGPIPWDDSRWVRYFMIAPNGVVVSQEGRCEACGQRDSDGRGIGEPSATGGNIKGRMYVASRGEVRRWNMILISEIRQGGANYTGPESDCSEPIWVPDWRTVALDERDPAVVEEAAIPDSEFERQFGEWAEASPFVEEPTVEEPEEETC